MKTVSELLNLLAKLDPDMPVLRVGDYEGEFYEIENLGVQPVDGTVVRVFDEDRDEIDPPASKEFLCLD